MPPQQPTPTKLTDNVYLIAGGLGGAAFLLLFLLVYLTSGSPEPSPTAEIRPEPTPEPRRVQPTRSNPPTKTQRRQPELEVRREPRRSIDAIVMRCVDGDTIFVQPVGKAYFLPPIRMIGLDAPVKATRDAVGQEPHGTEAQQFLSLKITRQQVRLEFDVVERQEDGLWAYIWLDDELLNETMLKAGWAMLDTRPPNVKYVERLQAAQQHARENQLGIWNPADPLEESPAKFAEEIEKRLRVQEALEDRLSIPRYQQGCVVGNRNTKKYHVPGGQYYDVSRDSKYVIYFSSATQARQAGYEPSAR